MPLTRQNDFSIRSSHIAQLLGEFVQFKSIENCQTVLVVWKSTCLKGNSKYALNLLVSLQMDWDTSESPRKTPGGAMSMSDNRVTLTCSICLRSVLHLGQKALFSRWRVGFPANSMKHLCHLSCDFGNRCAPEK